MSNRYEGLKIESVSVDVVEPAALNELRSRLAAIPRFCGPATAGATPVLWFRLASHTEGIMLRDAVAQHRQVSVFPWGWDFTFGSMLTISVMATGMSGPPPSACIPADDPAFPLLKEGRFIAIFAVGEKVLACFRVDLSGMGFPKQADQYATSESVNDGRGFYATQWERVKSHIPVLIDPLARNWESVLHRQVFKQHFTPAEQLSAGWLQTYEREVKGFAKMLKAMRAESSLDAVDASAFPGCVQVLVNAAKSYDLGQIMEHYASLHRELQGRPFFFLIEQLSKFMEAASESPIYHVVHAAMTLYMRNSETTGCGRRLPWVDDQGNLQHIQLNPVGWPPSAAIEEYWDRTPQWVTINIGRSINGDDFPADARPESPLIAQLPKATDIPQVNGSADALMDEAATNKQWTIPPRAIIDLHVGPFRRFELTEINDDVLVIARTSEGYFFDMVFCPAKRFARVPLGDSEANESQRAALSLVVAAMIRDFWVTERRETVFRSRKEIPEGRGPRLPVASLAPRVVYLPRITYVSTPDLGRCQRELAHAERRAHFVRAHLRRSEHVSDLQQALAFRYGFSLPNGYTFVRPHERGKQLRDAIYRSRSALQSLLLVSSRLRLYTRLSGSVLSVMCAT